MPYEPQYDLKTKRMIVAFLLAPLVPVGLNALMNGQLAPLALIFGLPIAYVSTYFLALPYSFFLRAQGKFNAVMIVAGAGFIAVIPDLLFTFLGFGLGGLVTLRHYGVDLVIDGQLTPAGLAWQLLRLLYFWLIGAIGGVAFWLIAVGRRWSPAQLPSNNPFKPTPLRGAA